MSVGSDTQPPVQFRLFETPVKVHPLVLPNLLVAWGGLAWLSRQRRPERHHLLCLLIGLGKTLALVSADVAHVMGHIWSARLAGAAVDEVRVPLGMPRTIYYDNDVPPRSHRMRALGGPLFSLVSLLLSLLLRVSTRPGSTAREMTDVCCLGHGMIALGALAPLPPVDGGSILKWTLVEKGRTPTEAEQVVCQVNRHVGSAAVSVGTAMALRRRWLPALGWFAGGGLALAAGLNKIR